MNGETELKILEKLITLDKGVEGICRRLDVSNGRIAKLEDKCDYVEV